MKSSLPSQKLSADHPLSPVERFNWLSINLTANLLSFLQLLNPPHYLTKSSLPSLKSFFFNNLDSTKSPSRFLCEEYLFRELVALFASCSKCSMHIYDFGCGSSSILDIIYKAYTYVFNKDNNLKVIYIGYDPYLPILSFDKSPDWLVISRSSEFSPDYMERELNHIDLSVSFSVLEHVYDDISQVNLISKFSLYQLHFAPSWCCLYVYLWHGYRIYNPFILRRLFSNLSDGLELTVYPIGSLSASLTYIVFTLCPQVLFYFFKILFKATICKDVVRLRFNRLYRYFLCMSVLNTKNSRTFPSFLLLKIV